MTRYDRRYFDKWYRHPDHRVRTAGELRRKVAMVVSIAETILDRRVHSILDVGCGEGEWLPALRKVRPAIHYQGIDPSEYAARRYGQARNVRLGTMHELIGIDPFRVWDLIVCSDVLHYVPSAGLLAPLREMAWMTEGIAFLEVMTEEDAPEGDMEGFHLRSARWYRRLFRRAGFTPIGMQCYVGPAREAAARSLEKFF